LRRENVKIPSSRIRIFPPSGPRDEGDDYEEAHTPAERDNIFHFEYGDADQTLDLDGLFLGNDTGGRIDDVLQDFAEYFNKEGPRVSPSEQEMNVFSPRIAA